MKCICVFLHQHLSTKQSTAKMKQQPAASATVPQIFTSSMRDSYYHISQQCLYRSMRALKQRDSGCCAVNRCPRLVNGLLFLWTACIQLCCLFSKSPKTQFVKAAVLNSFPPEWVQIHSQWFCPIAHKGINFLLGDACVLPKEGKLNYGNWSHSHCSLHQKRIKAPWHEAHYLCGDG